jgi:hypothetical protein
MMPRTLALTGLAAMFCLAPEYGVSAELPHSAGASTATCLTNKYLTIITGGIFLASAVGLWLWAEVFAPPRHPAFTYTTEKLRPRFFQQGTRLQFFCCYTNFTAWSRVEGADKDFLLTLLTYFDPQQFYRFEELLAQDPVARTNDNSIIHATQILVETFFEPSFRGQEDEPYINAIISVPIPKDVEIFFLSDVVRICIGDQEFAKTEDKAFFTSEVVRRDICLQLCSLYEQLNRIDSPFTTIHFDPRSIIVLRNQEKGLDVKLLAEHASLTCLPSPMDALLNSEYLRLLGKMYKAPETLLKRPINQHAADMFVLCSIIFAIVTGQDFLPPCGRLYEVYDALKVGAVYDRVSVGWPAIAQFCTTNPDQRSTDIGTFSEAVRSAIFEPIKIK